EDKLLDPKNTKKTIDVQGQEVSLLTMPGWHDGSFATAAPEKQRGSIESQGVVSSLHKGIKAKVDVYLPPGYKSGKERYPLLFLLDGVAARNHGYFSNALDHLTGHSIQPVITVFVGEVDLGENPPQDPAKYYEMISDFYGKEVVKFIDDHYRTRTDSASRAIIGNGFNGPDALATALKLPGLFGGVGSQ